MRYKKKRTDVGMEGENSCMEFALLGEGRGYLLLT